MTEPDCEIICPNCKTLITVDMCGRLKDERKKLLDELGKELNSRIAQMEILDAKNPSSFRKGIIEAYRDVEKWEMLQRRKGKEGV